MWGRHVLAAFLMIGSSAFSAAEQVTDLGSLGSPVKEPATSQPLKAEEFAAQDTDIGTREAALVELVSTAAGVVEEVAADAEVSLEPAVSHSFEVKDVVAAGQPEEVGSATPSAASSSSIRGRKLIFFGIIMLVVGVALSLAASRPRPLARGQTTPADETLQKTLEIMDKLGIQSASKLAVGCIVAGLVELFRSQKNSSQSAQTSQPTLKGRMLLLLGIVALLASLSSSGLDLSNLNVSELVKIILQYVSQAHVGLFLAGGATFLKSFYDILEHQKQQQQQEQQQQNDGAQQETVEAPADEKLPEAEVVADGSTAGTKQNQAENVATSTTSTSTPSNSPTAEPGPAEQSP
ncbi:uncharacterized protein EMH_0019670 [Eimeria mitis]|uniref:Transmembrane protein n=1 Tax=Eimeria mitis TaxID=44415 RepID=U6K8L4_9EIME|nr:uncharacterized protein EMH_0019670 [Eimeria mitis]CDJ34304.1 hypothetical protein EMH_0019670 [Eimeria mitis]